MPIDLARVRGAQLAPQIASWTPDDVILYHLALGAGVPPTTDSELRYTYEGRLNVLPTFGVIPAFGALAGVVGMDGMQINPTMVLHGEQSIEMHQPLPTSATVTTAAQIVDVFDKGKGAAVVAEARTTDAAGRALCTNRFTIFARGEGGFGGPTGPRAGNQTPERPPDFTLTSPTLEQQALLYRLCGDKNPLHADPYFAKLGGFERPILHGLCTYGIVCKAVVDHVLDGDVTKVSRYEARFSGTVFPGETIVTSVWKEDGRLLIVASTERGTPVISNAAITTEGAA